MLNLNTSLDKLIEAEKMAAIGNLVAGIAHEINTPVGIGVTAISQMQDENRKMADLYTRDALLRKDFKEYLQFGCDSGNLINKNLERTAEYIQSFKQVSVDRTSEKKHMARLLLKISKVMPAGRAKAQGKNKKITATDRSLLRF